MTDAVADEAASLEEARKRVFDRIDEGFCICEMIADADGNGVDYRFLDTNPRFEAMTGLTGAAGRTALELVPDLERKWVDAYARVGLGGETLRFEQSSEAMGRVFSVFATPVQPVGRFALVFRDITREREHETAIEALLREVNHRAKNMLGVVQSLARQTAREADPDGFVGAFSRRLAGLASSQDLLIASDWRAVGLESLLRSQLAFLGDDLEERVALAGPPVSVGPGAAQGIGMAIHELAANAITHGALSETGGSVDIEWTCEGPRFDLVWHESGGPGARAPERTGFGHTVITRMAEHAVGGAVDLDFRPGGLYWRLHADAARIAV
ncbi:MAG: HWE histidine kinase domain-containing protein [Oceanicaulis sp.]